MGIIHRLLENEKKISWSFIFSGLVLKVLVCSGTHWFKYMILIKGLYILRGCRKDVVLDSTEITGSSSESPFVVVTAYPH